MAGRTHLPIVELKTAHRRILGTNSTKRRKDGSRIATKTWTLIVADSDF